MIPQGLIKKLHDLGIVYEQDKVHRKSHAPELEDDHEQPQAQENEENQIGDVNGQEVSAS